MLAFVLKRIRATYRWVKALDLASKRQYREALGQLESIEQLNLDNDGSRYIEFHTQVAMLKASMLAHLDRYPDALKIISRVDKTLLDQAVPNSDYLRAYLSELARFTISNGQILIPRDLVGLINFRVADVDLTVPTHIKKKFPLPAHPNWK